MTKFFKRWWLLLLVSSLVLLLDQLTKSAVTASLTFGQSWEPIPAIGGFIKLTRSYNAGAAFGMLPFLSKFFLFLAIVTTVVFIISFPHIPRQATLSRISIAMIVGGALSNAVDRIRFGYVTDYVHIQITPNLANISNFADHAIFFGVILLLVDQWLNDRNEEEAVDTTTSAEVREENGVDDPPYPAEAGASSVRLSSDPNSPPSSGPTG